MKRAGKLPGVTGPLSRRVAAASLLALLAGCGYNNPYYDPAKPHHTPKGFRNNYVEGGMGGGFLKWQWERRTQGLPPAPENGYRFPMVKPDLEALARQQTGLSATWIGHATVLLKLGGLTILTDPMFSERAFAVQFAGPRRKVPPALQVHELPRIDVVLISHNHYDHLDRHSILALNRQAGGPPLFLVPLGLKPWLEEQGVSHARELDWWDKTELAGVQLHLVPVQHWSARSLNDRMRTLWGGWMLKAGGQQAGQVFFAGDTGYSKDFRDIHQRFGPVDLALIPVGAYEPRWFMRRQHVDPPEAVQIHRDLQARQSIGIHWGSFELTDEALDEPPRALARALQQAGEPAGNFIVLRHGETWKAP